MSNTFIPQAVEIVKQAIEADGAGEYEKALPLYRRSLEYFMTGLKYEQNPAGENSFINNLKAVSVQLFEASRDLESNVSKRLKRCYLSADIT